MITFYLDNYGPLMKKLEETPTHVMEAFLNASKEESEAMAEQIRSNASGGVLQARTGTLADSVQPTVPQITGLQAEAGVEAGGRDAYYGEIQETGISSPYPEEAHGHMMAFEEAGKTLFAKLVEHPAMPEHPWFTPVLDEMAPQIVESIQKAIQEEL